MVALSASLGKLRVQRQALATTSPFLTHAVKLAQGTASAPYTISIHTQAEAADAGNFKALTAVTKPLPRGRAENYVGRNIIAALISRNGTFTSAAATGGRALTVIPSEKGKLAAG